METATGQASEALRKVISLASAGALGKEARIEHADWDAVFGLAQEHFVLPLVGCALLHSPGLDCPERYREYALNVMRNASSGNLIRKQRVMHLLRELGSLGVDTRILKGYAAGRFYAYPECRDAGDADLLMDPCHEKKVNAFLKDKGFQLIERSPTGHHVVAAHPKYGKIEMHVSLYNGIVEDIWFRDAQNLRLMEEPVIVNEPEGKYETLGDTDHLIFIVLHMVKHFIGSGLTIRMLLDAALYFEKNRETIDKQRFWGIVEKLNYTGIVNAIFSLLIRCGGFSANSFPGMQEQSEEITDALVRDMLLGGYMGGKETHDRHTASMIYNRRQALKHKSKGQYLAYMVLWKIKSAVVNMFPSRQLLERAYPVVKKYPVLKPFYRVYRFFEYPVQKLRSGIVKQEIRLDDSPTTEIVKRRTELFKKLGLIL